MTKPITLTLMLAVCDVSSCFASIRNSTSTPISTISNFNTLIYKKIAWKNFMQDFVPIAHIRKQLKLAVNQYKEAKKILNHLNSQYGSEKVISISLLINSLRFSSEYQHYSYLLNMLFSTSLLFNIIYLHNDNLTRLILFFLKETVNFPVPSDIVGIIQRFLQCLSYEKDITLRVNYYYEPKLCSLRWGIALLGELLNTSSHFWILHHKNKDLKEAFLPTSQLKLNIYKPQKKYHHFFQQQITSQTVNSCDLKKNFTFFPSKNFQKFCVIELSPRRYLIINSVGNSLDDYNSRVEYGIINKNRIVKGAIGTRVWRDVASYHAQSKVHILGATYKGIDHRVFDCYFNSFFPSQYQNNLMDRHSFYKVFTEKDNGHVWGLSDAKLTNYSTHYQKRNTALLFDLCKERSILELVSDNQKVFSYLDMAEEVVAFSRYEESMINFFDKRVPFTESIITYSLEKVEEDCSVKKVHFLSDANYLLAECRDEFYLIDRRYPTPVGSMISLDYKKKAFLKDYNLLVETDYGLLEVGYLHYMSIDKIK